MNPNFKFSCETLDTINGYKLKAAEPDNEGFYTISIGCMGAPTQASIIYDPESTIAAMGDTNGRFYKSLREGYLKGEWGHPVIDDAKDPKQMARLLRIDEHYISHYFGKIWVDEQPVPTGNGETGYRVMAKVKPSGPYGEYLERSLRDPHDNTSFSIRCVCLPMLGPRKDCQYRKVVMMVTFDAVHAPGFAIANKRYSTTPGMESFNGHIENIANLNNSGFNEYEFDQDVVDGALSLSSGMESSLMIDRSTLRRIYKQREITMGNRLVGVDTVGRQSINDPHGTRINAANLLYSAWR